MNMKKLHKDQRGLTLIELVIVIAITGIITAGITMTIFQVFNINTRASNRMTAVSQVQHAGKLVSEDILEAQSVNATGSWGFPLTLNWIEGGGTGDSHTVIYTLEDGELWRSESVEGEEGEIVTRVAEYIDPDQTSCVTEPEEADPEDVEVVTFKVTATVGEQSEQRIYRVQPRPGS